MHLRRQRGWPSGFHFEEEVGIPCDLWLLPILHASDFKAVEAVEAVSPGCLGRQRDKSNLRGNHPPSKW